MTVQNKTNKTKTFRPELDENEQLTPEEMDLMQLFMDDGLVVMKEKIKEKEIKTTDMPSTLSEDYLDIWGPKNKLTMNLIQQLRNSDYLPLNVKRIALMVLRRQATYKDDATGVTTIQSQRRLDKLGEFYSTSTSSKTPQMYCGATRMVLFMVSDPRHQDVLPQVLQLGNALLEGGNKVRVLASWIRFLCSVHVGPTRTIMMRDIFFV